MTELYTVMAEREKGAIGLIFEMNYFLGVGVAIYSIWLIHVNAKPVEEYEQIYNFVKY